MSHQTIQPNSQNWQKRQERFEVVVCFKPESHPQFKQTNQINRKDDSGCPTSH